MLSFSRCRILVPALTAVFSSAACFAGNPTITSGFNLGATPTTLNVPFQPGSNSYTVNEALTFVASAGPIDKTFAAPTQNGNPAIILASQPSPFLVNENFSLTGGNPTINNSVRDWHEIILTPGWIWVLPGNGSFPSLFPQGTSLITRDGQPWASTLQQTQSDADLSVRFTPIDIGHALDIHKALLFVGTVGNTTWGDGTGETSIQIREYPTPEPSSLVLAILAAVALLLCRKRSRR